MLVVFPLGLLSVVWIFDVVHLATGQARWAEIAFYLLVAGLVGGLLAAVPGLIDWLSVARDTRAYRVGRTHLLLNLCGLALFVVSGVMRLRQGLTGVSGGALVLGLLGFLTLVVSGWFGGELVERLGVSVHPDANLNAPSSLRGEPPVPMPRRPSEPQPA
jgi:uncharacterized membrane protein